MKEIERYQCTEDGGVSLHRNGGFVRWTDVEALQRENDDLRAKALAAVWLLPEDVGAAELQELREEARAVFMGKDKQVIAKLQDELKNTQEALRASIRPPRLGVNNVLGVRSTQPGIRFALALTRVDHAPNGGLEIEVRLP